MTWVCTREPERIGLMPRATPSALVWTSSFQAVACRDHVAVADHVAKLPAGIHVQQRKRQLRRKERLEGKVQHRSGILADRVEHDRMANSAATSRMMPMDSASKRCRWIDSANLPVGAFMTRAAAARSSRLR
jgi:hypothetical protein